MKVKVVDSIILWCKIVKRKKRRKVTNALWKIKGGNSIRLLPILPLSCIKFSYTYRVTRSKRSPLVHPLSEIRKPLDQFLISSIRSLKSMRKVFFSINPIGTHTKYLPSFAKKNHLSINAINSECFGYDEQLIF